MFSAAWHAVSSYGDNLYPVFRASTFLVDRNNGCPLQEPYTRMQRYAFRWVCPDWVRMLANVIRIRCCSWHTQSGMLGFTWVNVSLLEIHSFADLMALLIDWPAAVNVLRMLLEFVERSMRVPHVCETYAKWLTNTMWRSSFTST